MRIFQTDHQDSRHERRGGSQASARLLIASQRETCSPRAAIAFSALSAVTWLREKARNIFEQITGKKNTTGRQKVAVEERTNIILKVHGN